MTLNENSLNANLYRWFYGKFNLPTNLCPFFWKLVAAWILLIPFSLFCLPTIVMDIFSDDFTLGKGKPGDRLWISLVIWIGLFLATCMILGIVFMFCDLGSFTNMATTGIFLWVIGFICGIGYLCSHGYEKYQDSKKKYDQWGYRIYEEKTDNILIGFIKAKYNEWCPVITWVKK
jgi:hypothetical protein